MYSKDMQLWQLSKAFIVDVGGFTLDYLPLRYGEPDSVIFGSLEKGIIPLYNEIKNRVRKQLDILLEDSDVDLVIREIGFDFNLFTTIFVGAAPCF